MIKMRCPTFWAKICIAGPIDKIEQTCREWCLIGACVTVTPTNYIYTMGEERGAEIGLINYPRFPKEPKDIIDQAQELGHELMEKCCQGSFTIMTPDDTLFFSRRRDDESIPCFCGD
ncbi:MAG: hypothetical protein GY814_00580 [Gammaproteobacteria bacterium]|nr:hypothetical protein [Gammaproteobacteria bacterium]